MIDNFALLVSHGLLMLTAWMLLGRADLDRDEEETGEASAARGFARTEGPPRASSGQREPPPRA